MRHIFDLTSDWEMRPVSDPEWLPAIVPGSVYVDLMNNGKMPDPYYRDQEAIAYDLMETDYVYRKTFVPDAALLGALELRLVMEGIDTLADISINNQFVLHTENMHRTYMIDIRSFVHEGENTLTILLRSPLRAAHAAYERHQVPGSSDSVQGFAMIRKAHCMYGWDWGPRLPDAGIYRPIYLWAVSEPKLKSVQVRQMHRDGRVTLSLNPEMDIPSGTSVRGLSVRYTLTDPDGNVVCTSTDSHMFVEQPRLWWPNGYGEHPLYTLKAELFNEAGLPIDTWEKRIGLRTFDITRQKDEQGESFAFTINGVSIFAMGADYIPEDNLLSRITPERTRILLEDAAMAHFNTIRVWGGGYYPDDFFFDICDELGLLVWQDFMFACAMYDLTPEFEENIRAEFCDVIRRLRHHPSLALWCGNNEIESSVVDGWYKTLRPSLKADYTKIFEYILPQMTSQMDPDRPYWPSSPSSGGAYDQPSAPNRGVCMGAIYWQLNDCWPVASWASIDYYGRWKALHYAARRFFAPVLLSCEETGLHTDRTNVNDERLIRTIPRRARLNVSNETLYPVDVEVQWSLRDPKACKIQEGSETLTVPALSAVWLPDMEFPDADFFGHYLSYTLLMDGNPVSSGSSLFCAPKHFHFADPHLTLERDGNLITVHADAYARMVEIVCDDGDVVLSDNDFDMDAGSRTVRILRGCGSAFRVRSVFDIR